MLTVICTMLILVAVALAAYRQETQDDEALLLARMNNMKLDQFEQAIGDIRTKLDTLVTAEGSPDISTVDVPTGVVTQLNNIRTDLLILEAKQGGTFDPENPPVDPSPLT